VIPRATVRSPGYPLGPNIVEMQLVPADGGLFGVLVAESVLVLLLFRVGNLKRQPRSEAFGRHRCISNDNS
jgi:hypothetical protein